VHGNTPISSGVSFTREGVRVVITLTTASTYQATLTPLVDGAGNTVSGNLRNNPGPISRLRLFNANAGTSPDNDVFFNRITYYRGRVLNTDTGRGYLNIQPAIDDPATLAGHTISVSAGLYTGTQNNNIVINKPRLTLIGAGPTATIISRTASGTLRGIEIAPSITGTTISSLRVQGFNDGGICAIQNNHFTTITNTHVYSNTAGGNCLGGIYMNGPVNHVLISHNEAVNNTSRGIVIWNGFKTNITITHNLVRNNNCCGIELQDGTASGVLIAHNTVRDNFDNGIGTVGLTAGAGPNLIYSNTLINNGRFGIEVKLPNGSGLPSGDGSIVVLSNTVALTDTIANIKPGEQRDLAGIAAFRRAWVAGFNNVDIPAGVIIQGNVVSGYQQPSASDGFGIVVEGARMTVISNTLENNDVGVQVQAGHTPYAPFTNTDGDQSNLADQYFGRGNSPVACAFYQAGNVFTGNLTNTRQVGTVTPGTVSNLNTGQTFCGIQQAIDAPPTLGGHVLSLTGDTFTGTVIARKPLVIVGAGPGQTIIQSLSPGIVVTTSNVTISNTSIVGTGSDVGITTTFGVTNLTVSNVHISNFAQGVALLGGHSHTVQNSVFTLTNVITSVGVGMTGLTTTLPITNVLVSGNVFTGSGYAVAGLFANQNAIVGNQMRYGTAGVRLAGANGNLIEGNQIENNSSYAIYLAPNVPFLIPPVLSNSNNVISGNVALNHPNDRAIQIINSSQPGNGNQIVNNVIQNAGQAGIFTGAGSGDTNLLIAGNTVISAGAGVFVGSSLGVTVSGNTVTNTVTGLVIASSGHVSITANNLLTNSTGLSLTNSASNPVTATLNILSGNGTGVLFNSGNAGGLLLTRNAIAGNGAGITNTAVGTLNAECNWYGAADGPSGVGSGSGDSVSTGVDFNPWLLSSNLNGPCSSGSLTVQKVLVGPITPTTAWQFTATVPTGTLVFTLPAGGGAVTFSGLDFGQVSITETTKLGYIPTSSCTTGATGGASISFNLIGNVTCTFTNTITPATTVITVTPVITNGWFYITETVGPGTGLLPFDIVLPPPDPTLGAASARLVITNVNWRHMYLSPIFTGTRLSDITVFEYRLRIPSASPQFPYINIGWDDDVTDGNTGFRGRLVYTPPSLPANAWHIVDARNDPTPRWYTTLTGATQCTSGSPCTFAQLVAAYPNAAIHPDTFFGVPRGFIGIRVGGTGATGTGYADGLRVGVGSQITLFDFEAAPPTTITLTTNPTMTVVGSNVLLTATVTISNGDPAADGTVVSFTTSLGNVSPVTATTVGGVVTATLNSTVAGVAAVTATVNSLSATAQVTFTAGAPFTLTLTAVPTTLPVDNSSTLTATATDQFGNPVADGTTISFTTSLGTLSSATATTSGGNASVTLNSTLPGVATVTATVGSLNATTLVTFTAGAPFTLTLTAVPATLPVGNSSTLTATATDQFGNPVADGTTISFTTSLGNVSPVTATTVGGVVTATLNSTVAGVAAVTATIGSLSATAQVTFTPGAPFTLTLTAVPATLPVGNSSTLTATATDQYGNPVADGTTISFTTSLGALSSSTANTSGGDASVTLSSTVASVATVTATVNSLSATAQVTFTPGAPFTLTLTAVPATLPVGNSSTLTATATDQFGNPVADGTTISFTTSLGGVSPVTATTVGGVVTATLNSTVAGVATVTATVNSLSATTQVTFTAGAPFTLTLTAVPATLSVGNSSTLTATATDQFGNPVADGTTISFTTSLGTLSSSTANTSGGDASVTLSSIVAGVATVTATVNSLSTTAQVTFTAGAPFTLTLTAVPTTLPVGNSSTLTATATDQFGNPVADGTTISFTTSLGALSSSTANTSGGDASVTLSSIVAGVATVTATVNSLSTTAQVTFTPGAPFTFTFTLTPTVIVANGISQSLATATVVDQFGNPVSGVTVNFLAGIGTFSPASGATNASGQITATLTSLTPAIENVFAVVSGLGFRSAQATYVNPPASSAPLTSTLQTVTQTLGVVRKGGLITYTLTVTNTGAGQINNVLLFAPIPSGTTYVAGSASGGNFSGSFAMLLTGQELGEGRFGPQAALNAVTWSGNLPSGASHTLSYVVQVQILEGQVVNQPKVFVDNADTGMNLSSAVDVVAYKIYMPIVRRQ
jgi:parallel beta-helix repeat protein